MKSAQALRELLLAVVVASMLTRPALEARAIGGLNSVTLSPTHGRVAFSFQVTYAISPCLSAAGLTIAFSWNALPPAGQVLGSATTDASCRATLTAKPPATAAPGNYLVYGYVPLGTGGAAPNTEASATYTIDVTPTARASPSPTATARPTASASATTAASATASASAVTSPDASALSSSQPSTSASGAGNAPASAARDGGTHQPEWWTTINPVVLIGAAMLLALLLAVLAFLLFHLLRRRSASKPSKSGDRAA